MGPGQNSKQRGLAYLGQADDSSLHKRALVKWLSAFELAANENDSRGGSSAAPCYSQQRSELPRPISWFLVFTSMGFVCATGRSASEIPCHRSRHDRSTVARILEKEQ